MSKPLTDVTVELTERDGNAVAIISRVSRALRLAGHEGLATKFREEAISGDYDHVLKTCFKYVDVI